MQPYQKEYIKNIKAFNALNIGRKAGDCSFEEYEAALQKTRQNTKQMIKHNTKLLREGLIPTLDHMPEANQKELQSLAEFAEELFNQGNTLDTGLFCQLHQAMLNFARQKRDRNGMIRELYWLGMGRLNIYQKLVGLDFDTAEKYISQMRLCFTEAAAYLKYFDEIDDADTRGYILRSRANISLGRFKTPSEKIHLVKQTLQILQDQEYQKKAPELPWERYVYTAHQQMAASISHSKENPMTAQDIADSMESVYIVYQRRLQEAAAQGLPPPLKPAFPYYVIEFQCGLDTIKGLLTKIEQLMDRANPYDYSADNMYGLISLPAFYCQYLTNYPEMIPERKEYIASLYRRILSYMDAFPETTEHETLFLYLRQLSHTFLETDNSITYAEFLRRLLMRFMPDVYVQCYTTGKTAVCLCRLILQDEPDFFDDIEHIRGLTDPAEKQQAVLDYAMNCGLYHDVGKIDFNNLYSQIARRWFAEEYEMAHLHTVAGETLLSERPSTRPYAAAALGHHCWYDGSRGYPEKYKRLECPSRQMVDVIGLVSWLINMTTTSWQCIEEEKTFDETIAMAIALEGKRFSPLLTTRLHDEGIVEQLRTAIADAQREADYNLYTYTG